jgi:hypothetical protein
MDTDQQPVNNERVLHSVPQAAKRWCSNLQHLERLASCKFALAGVDAWTDFEAESNIRDCDCAARTDLILS